MTTKRTKYKLSTNSFFVLVEKLCKEKIKSIFFNTLRLIGFELSYKVLFSSLTNHRIYT